MNKITVYGEIQNNDITNSTLELVSKAYELKLQSVNDFKQEIKIETVIISNRIDEFVKQKIFNAGSDRVTLIKYNQEQEFLSTIYSKIFVEYFNQNPSDVILFPATEKIRTLAPRITTMLDTGLVADCTELELISKNGEVKLASTRPTFGGELMATILSKKNPQCATVRPKTFKIREVENNSDDYFEFTPSIYDEDRIKLLRSLIENSSNVPILSDAKIVLVGGYGIISNNKNEYFDKLKKMAKMFNASVGVTRKVVDYGIMSYDKQIGQTGLTIQPELYIAFGVSGAIQHIMGMKNSKVIVAINTDENAEIFKYADYKIVADAKEVIDEILSSVL